MARKTRQPFRTNLSINDIRATAWNATQGSTESYKKLQEENRRLARLANSRMRALERAGLEMGAYNHAYTYLKNSGLRRFSTVLASPSDYKGMVDQMSELTAFINAKASTVAGARTALNEKMDKIEEFTGKHYDYDQRIKLGKLFGTDSISTLLQEVRGDSGDVIEMLEAFSLKDLDDERLSSITSIIDKHLAGYNPFEDNPFFANFDYLSYDKMMDELRNLNKENEG